MKPKSTYLVKYDLDLSENETTEIRISHPDGGATVITMDTWDNDQEIAEALTAYCNKIGHKLFQETVYPLLNSGLVYREHSGGEYIEINWWRPVEVANYPAPEEN